MKQNRTEVIKDYLNDSRIPIIILSCGNSYRHLVEAFPDNKVIGLATSHPYTGCVQLEDRYYTSRELNRLYPDTFNATPGMLPSHLYRKIGEKLYKIIHEAGWDGSPLMVPLGSGETLHSLGQVFSPDVLRGYYDMGIPEICYDHTMLTSIVEGTYIIVNLTGKELLYRTDFVTWIVTLPEIRDKLRWRVRS